MALFRRNRHGMLARLFQRLRPYRLRVSAVIGIILMAQAPRLVLPLITREVVNAVLPSGNFTYMLILGAQLLGLTAVRSALMYARGMMAERISQDFIFSMRSEIYSRLQAQSYTFYDRNRIGDIMSRMTGDMEGVRAFVMNLLVTFLEQTLTFVGALAFMGTLNWTLTLVVLSLCPPLACVAYLFNKRIRPAHTAVREQNAVLNTRTQENIAGVRVVKAFARESYESDCFRTDNQKVLHLNLTATRIWSNFHPVMDFIGSLAVPLMLLAGGRMVAAGQMDLGTLIAQTGYIWMLTNPMHMLGHYVNVFAQGMASAEKLFYYLDLGSIVRDPENPITPAVRAGQVEFDHATLSYGDKVVLRDITLEAKPGETVALLGATGSGKTSVVNLIGRFYDVSAGRVLVDGVDVREQKLASLRTHIGYVMQETFLFSDSIAECIAFGRPEMPGEAIERASDIAEASEFITHMPLAYETIVGERGLGLSGGQKQRVAIARALAIDPTILILDDATSAVDMETEAIIQQKLARIPGSRTTFIIAHRISSVLHADQILIIEDGQIVERGRHQELLERKGLYYGMFMDQYRDIMILAGKKEV
ncbi:MAG: ABC transporter ATP-binding protein/permease [Clostridia bacterium]|nr:ABC transporter ATP-binding protein/permease [Clostridia bacterium]